MLRNRSTTRAWTAAAQPSRGLWALLALTLAACSSGDSTSPGYASYTGQPFMGDGDDGDTDTDGETGIDLDGGEPPPRPGDGGEPPPPPGGQGDCCKGHDTPGCDNEPVQECVCESDAWCCESEWDDACAALIEQLGCGHCTAGDPPPPPGDDPPPPPGEDDGGDPPPPGETDGGDPPPPPGDGGDPPPEDPPAEGGDCCTAAAAPGCTDAAVEACVCMQDSYCCETAWDALCVDEVGSFGCGTCEGAGGDGGEAPSVCCEQQAGAGCPDAAVEACVCAVDDYCCSVFWDLTCAGEVETLSCGSCA